MHLEKSGDLWGISLKEGIKSTSYSPEGKQKSTDIGRLQALKSENKHVRY